MRAPMHSGRRCPRFFPMQDLRHFFVFIVLFVVEFVSKIDAGHT